MASTSNNWRIPRDSSHISSFANRNNYNNKKHTNPPVNERFWHRVTWIIPFYRCQVCHNVMSKKIPTTAPQQIYSCGHITCAKCIVNSFFVELNPFCPVDGCNKYVNASISTHTTLPPLNILQGESHVNTNCSSPTNEIVIPTENAHHTDEPTSEKEEDNDKDKEVEEETVVDKGFQDIIDSYLKDVNFKRISLFDTVQQLDGNNEGEIDTLACGCTDICRGRCGIYDNKYDRNFDYRTTY